MSQEEFNALFNQSLDALLILKKKDGTILQANEPFRRQFGYESSSGVVGKHFSSLFSNNLRLTNPTLEKEVCSGVGSWENQLLLTAKKSMFGVNIVVSSIPWENNEAVLATLTECSASRKIRAGADGMNQECPLLAKCVEEKTLAIREGVAGECSLLQNCVDQKTSELAQINEELMRAVKAKDTFLAIMSHELRTPMNSVCGFADSLLRTTLEGKQQIYAQSINSSARRLLRIINDILDFSKIEAGRMELESVPFNWAAIVREAFQVFKPQINLKNIRTHIDIKNDFPSQLKGDPHRVQQILMNLLANAVKFTERGEIRFEATCQNLESNGSTQRIETHFLVSDTGIGIPPEKMGVLFQPFQQTDLSTTRKFGGTGLGLAICKRLCELMGGRIWAEHGKGGWGAVFHVVLPFEAAKDEDGPAVPFLSAQDEAWEQKALSETATRRSFDWKALVVESSPLGQEVARELLQDLGCEVVIAISTDETLEKLRQEKFDLILLNMKLLDGEKKEEIVREMRSCSPNEEKNKHFLFGMIPPTSDVNREFCLGLGMDDCLTQPLDVKQLSRAMEQLTAQEASV
ncbi:MAG: ATP-binding protein [bacterium]